MTRLDRLPPLPARHAVAVAAAVAQAVADLHAHGAPHGGLGPDQVWLDGDGAVHLADPPVADGRAGDTADDLAALGRLLDWLADRAPDRPARRLPLVAPVLPVEVLRDLARGCRRVEGRRPTAQEVASALRARVPAASFPTVDAATRPVRPRRGVVLGSAAAVALAGAAVLPSRCAHRQGAVEPVARPMWADGVLVVDGRRYAVGAPGDDVVIGRWQCAGPRVLFLLRAATGDLVRFDRLPVDDRPLPGRVVARMSGARRLLVGRDGRGCAVPTVLQSDGRAVSVPTAGTP